MAERPAAPNTEPAYTDEPDHEDSLYGGVTGQTPNPHYAMSPIRHIQTPNPLDVLRLGYTYNPHLSLAEFEAALAHVQALAEAARNVVYPFRFDRGLILDEWRGSQLAAALVPFAARENTEGT